MLQPSRASAGGFNIPSDRVYPDAGEYGRFCFEPVLKDAKIKEYTWHNNRQSYLYSVALKLFRTRIWNYLTGLVLFGDESLTVRLAAERNKED